MSHHPSAAQPPNLRRRLSIGIVCMALGFAGVVATIVIALVGAFATDGDVPLDGRPHTIAVEAGAERMLFVHRHSDTSCTVVDPATGDPIDLERVGPDISRSVNSVERVARWKFAAPGDSVAVTCTGDTNVDAQVAPSVFTAKNIALGIAGLVLAAGVGVVGLVLVVVALVKRSRDKTW